MRAMTAPASDRRSVVVDNRATASTPTRPHRRSRTIEAASPSKTGIVASVQARWARRGWSTARARIPGCEPDDGDRHERPSQGALQRHQRLAL